MDFSLGLQMNDYLTPYFGSEQRMELSLFNAVFVSVLNAETLKKSIYFFFEKQTHTDSLRHTFPASPNLFHLLVHSPHCP